MLAFASVCCEYYDTIKGVDIYRFLISVEVGCDNKPIDCRLISGVGGDSGWAPLNSSCNPVSIATSGVTTNIFCGNGPCFWQVAFRDIGAPLLLNEQGLALQENGFDFGEG